MKYRIIKQTLPYEEIFYLQCKRHWFSRWKSIKAESYYECCERKMERLILLRDTPCEVLATEKTIITKTKENKKGE